MFNHKLLIMNLLKFLNQFSTENLTNKKNNRREALKQFGKLGRDLAVVSSPLALALTPTASVKAQSSGNSAVDALQLALTLEYLEAEFYIKALDSGVIPGGTRAEKVYMQISKHESAHVDFLIAGLEGAGADPVEKPDFDFTADGTFDPFNENGTGQETAYAQLLALAQAFEDTGVRAYKGQAGNVQGSDFLTVALQIHSVEARHASEIRRLRGLEGWITQDERGPNMPAQTQAVYDGEDNLVQGGVNLSGMFNDFGGNDAITQAFDEPMAGDTASTIASLFIED